MEKNIFRGGLVRFFICLISLPLFVCLKPAAGLAQSMSYLTSSVANTYTLTQAAMTSAGVYNADSVLVRTLWTTKNIQAGTYAIDWDGKDDLGKAAPKGNYTVKIVANNVKYTWSGIIGNTSKNNQGNTVHRGMYYFMTGMTIVNNTAYYCSGYSEARPSIAKFLTTDPQVCIQTEKSANQTTANTDIVASDGKIVYWAGWDPYAKTRSWVFANKVADDSDVTFSNGRTFKPVYARSYNAINYVDQTTSFITGLAVQKTGNYLFVTRKGLNKLYILDKRNGASLSTITVKKPKGLCIDANDNLWMISDSNKICKYKVATNATISAPLITIQTAVAPIAIAVSPDNATLAVADGAIDVQQVKGFNTSTGKQIWTIGDAGGYVANSVANNYKFYFNDVRGKMRPNEEGFRVFIAYQPDGSFWVNDPGNFRVLRYSKDNKFMTSIMAMGPSYSTWADKNDNTLMGAEYLEFKIDNSARLTGTTGWQLTKNWGATVGLNYDKTVKFRDVITLTSGGVKRRFGTLRNSDNLYYLVEFKANNTLRFTNIKRKHFNIDKDGSILTDDLLRYKFLNFDKNGDPVWSATAEVLGKLASLPDKGPLPKEGFRNTYLTTSGKVIFYDYSTELTPSPVTYNTGAHLAATKIGTNNFLWKTAYATARTYTGSYPDASRYDIGNNVKNNAGSSLMVLGRNLIAGYHGEFWKNGQTNKYNHYLDNGLAIGQFGVSWTEVSGVAPPMMAGNALTPQLVAGPTSDVAYMFHGDESWHGGVHKWEITGLNTIAEISVPISYPSPSIAAPQAPGIDLLAGLASSGPIKAVDHFWQTTTDIASRTAGYWTVETGVRASTADGVDLCAKYSLPSGIRVVTRDLQNTRALNSWSLFGKINWETNYPNAQTNGGGSYVEILDDAGRVISRLYTLEYYKISSDRTTYICGNDTRIATGSRADIQVVTRQTQPFEISAVDGKITFKYANYATTTTAKLVDVKANWKRPATLRLYFWTSNSGENYSRLIDVEGARFVADKLPQTITFNAIPNKDVSDKTVILTAYSDSNLPVTYSLVTGPGTITGNKLEIKGAGIIVIKAQQNGDTIFKAADPTTQAITVLASKKTVLM